MSHAAASAAMQRKEWRVKVYRLDVDGKWQDEGTGNVTLKYIDRLNKNALQVISDNERDPPGKVILESAIVSEDVYSMQGKMIITWNDPGNNVELALSFEDTRGCEDIWDQLCALQGRVSANFNSGQGGAGGRMSRYDSTNVDDLESSNNSGKTRSCSMGDESDELPPPNIANLEQISNLLNNAGQMQREAYLVTVMNPAMGDINSAAENALKQSEGSNAVSSPPQTNQQGDANGDEGGQEAAAAAAAEKEEGSDEKTSRKRPRQEQSLGSHAGDASADVGRKSSPRQTYLGALLDLLPQLEANPSDNESLRGLQLLFNILRTLVLFNEPNLMELMFADEYFMDIVGVLEYDPEIVPRVRHREYLASRSAPQLVIPIEDDAVTSKINKSFRVRFFRDSVLTRTLDEVSLAMLTEMDVSIGIQIATALHTDEKYLVRTFAKLRDENTPQADRAQVVACLQELCAIAKKMQVPARNAFYRSLVAKGGEGHFFRIFERILSDPKSSVSERLNIGDVLKLVLEHDPAQLREFILSESRSHPALPNIDRLTEGIDVSQVTNASVAEMLETQKQLFALPPPPQAPDTAQGKVGQPHLSLMAQLLKRLVWDPEAGMQAQASEILRMLLDPETMEAKEKDLFLTMFYEKYIQWLVIPLELFHFPLRSGSSSSVAGATAGNSSLSSPAAEAEAKAERAGDGQPSTVSSQQYSLSLQRPNGSQQLAVLAATPGASLENRVRIAHVCETARVAEHHITELLAFCIQTHGFRTKYFVVQNSVLGKVLHLLESSDKHLVLGALRLVRTCVGLKDNFYNSHLVQLNHFKPIFRVFVANGPRNNLINSAIMELLEFIRLENIRGLVSYVVEGFGPLLETIDYVDTYTKLKEVYEKNMEEEKKLAGSQKAHQASASREQGHTAGDGEAFKQRKRGGASLVLYGADEVELDGDSSVSSANADPASAKIAKKRKSMVLSVKTDVPVNFKEGGNGNTPMPLVNSDASRAQNAQEQVQSVENPGGDAEAAVASLEKKDGQY